MSAPEQHFAFQNPYALEVRFDGLFLVEEEPRGDGEEDDDAHFAIALHDELEEDPLRPQRKILSIIAIVNDEMMGENHEHCNDAQQFYAGITPPFEIRVGGTALWEAVVFEPIIISPSFFLLFPTSPS